MLLEFDERITDDDWESFQREWRRRLVGTHRQLFEELAAEQGELKLLVPRTLELTVTLRGSRSGAEAEARGMLRRALTRHLAGIAFKRKLGD